MNKIIKKIGRQWASISMICTALVLLSGCADYLDVSRELADNININTAFTNPTYFKQWYGGLYDYLPNYSETGLDGNNARANPWAWLSGELVCSNPTPLAYSQNTYTAESSPFHRWMNCYQNIRQIMIFLDRAPDKMGSPTDQGGYISEQEMLRYKADATYLEAYYYFMLFELYGPTPIITELADPQQTNIDYERASMDEMVNHIDTLLERLISGPYKSVLKPTLRTGEGLDTELSADNYNLLEILRPTMGAVYALRARLWVYAASPLYNGGYKEALSVTNKDGKHLFPDYDANKWLKAKECLEDLLQFAEQNGMHLYKSKDGDPNKSVYELFQYYNDEILWANGNNDYNDGTSSKMEARTIPGDIPGGMGNVGPYQDFVDLFFTENGLDIHEDTAYHENGFVDYENRCTTKNSAQPNLHIDKHIFTMNVNREPRFYADITYEGKSWHIQRDMDTYKDWGAYFERPVNTDQNKNPGGAAFQDNTMHARAGYLLYKFNNRTLLNAGSYPKDWGRPWIYFRLADFYLYYAEVCNEINPNDPNIIKYLDLVRERAGIPGYAELKASGVKDIVGDQEKQREAIQRERAIELFAEGNYYFDTHRWMTAGYATDDKGNRIKNNEDKLIPRRGMDIGYPTAFFNDKKLPQVFYDKIGEGSFYNRIVLDRYPWSKAMLLYPIPYNEMQKSLLTVQNPLW
ncbi:MAG: RagB/SusD family nutrient uptake outer membrane protein [Mediterranea sp.]|jgi:hypothetical protein|nr:RagB/SusD family nutrient uptake outer membrane protein [Mediterranea sp.]